MSTMKTTTVVLSKFSYIRCAPYTGSYQPNKTSNFNISSLQTNTVREENMFISTVRTIHRFISSELNLIQKDVFITNEYGACREHFHVYGSQCTLVHIYLVKPKIKISLDCKRILCNFIHVHIHQEKPKNLIWTRCKQIQCKSWTFLYLRCALTPVHICWFKPKLSICPHFKRGRCVPWKFL